MACVQTGEVSFLNHSSFLIQLGLLNVTSETSNRVASLPILVAGTPTEHC